MAGALIAVVGLFVILRSRSCREAGENMIMHNERRDEPKIILYLEQLSNSIIYNNE